MTQPTVMAQAIHRHLPIGDMQLHILRGITFEVAAGGRVALMGPSGYAWPASAPPTPTQGP